jgi:hypothetical protein
MHKTGMAFESKQRQKGEVIHAKETRRVVTEEIEMQKVVLFLISRKSR